jgi:hypothetical protein
LFLHVSRPRHPLLAVWSDSTTEVHCISASHFRMKSNSAVFFLPSL